MKKLWMLLVLPMLIITAGCGKVVPPGTTVMVLDAKGGATTYTKGSYFAYGRDKVYFIDTKLKSFSKDMKILCVDEINMDVSSKWVGSFKVTDATIETIKSKVPSTKVSKGDVEGYELSLEQFYKLAVDDIVSSITRQEISRYKTDSIRDQREKIRDVIKKEVLKRLETLKYPLETSDILITNLDYPIEVTAMRKRIKTAELKDQENAAIAKAAVAKAERDAELAEKQGAAEVVRAQKKAEANKILTSSLTPEIIMLKQFEAMERLASGPNNTVLIMPFAALNGGMPEAALTKQAIEDLKRK